jgi:hypothetical protein
MNACKKCGCTVGTIKQTVSGWGLIYWEMEEDTLDYQNLHDSLEYKNVNKYAYCANCGARLEKVDSILERATEK